MFKKIMGMAVLAGLSLILGNPAQLKAEGKATEKTIVEIAAGNKNFSKLVTAVKAADLVGALSGEGPFTLFAPIDQAFEALGEDPLKAVLADKKKLTGILTYHVIKGKVLAEDALALAREEKSARTLNGAEIKLSIKDGALFLNGDVKVIKTNILGKNGVIHVIDKVLMPPAPSEERRNACKIIEEAVHRGVRLYNSGHHQECAAVYHDAVRSLLSRESLLSSDARHQLTLVIGKVSRNHCPSSNAWTLRLVLDEMYDQMQPLQARP